ncbi:hypothetical protein ACS0TY_015326 [Phlomoides rotata]
MKQQEQQPWTLSLRARAKNLDLKLKLSRIFFPLPKPTQFSIQFKLLSYALEIRSKPKSTFPLKPKLLKRKFLQIFKIFHRERSRNNGIVRSWCAPKVTSILIRINFPKFKFNLAAYVISSLDNRLYFAFLHFFFG